MLKKYFPFLLSGGLIAYYFYQLKSAGDNIKVNLSSVSISKGKGISLPFLLLKFNVQNVTNAVIDINSIVGDIYINGNYFANVSNFNKVIVPRKGSTIYDVKVQTGILDVFSVLNDFIKKKTKKLVVSGDLKINANNIIIPISINRTII